MSQAHSAELDYDAVMGDVIVYLDDEGHELDREAVGGMNFQTSEEKTEFLTQKLSQYNS